ncbi:tetrahydromethanopterin S-methyltransferase subunit H [Candidatus Altiarchaeota archaeon]
MVNVAGVRVGGQVSLPACLVSTIFYDGEKLFLDGKKGLFDEGKAKSLLVQQESMGEELGIPGMVDVFLSSEDSLEGRIDFVAEKCGMPFWIDSTDVELRLKALRYVEEVGLVDRVVYNSINAGITEKEIYALKESPVSASIVLAFNPVKKDLSGRVEMLENGGGVVEKGLLEIAKDCGIKKVLVDTGITPIGEGAGAALRAVAVCKARFGWPTGNAVHNAVTAWTWFRESQKPRHVDFASNLLVRMMGADFILYGPIEFTKEVYEEMVLAENIIGEAAAEFGLKMGKEHPFNKLKH